MAASVFSFLIAHLILGFGMIRLSPSSLFSRFVLLILIGLCCVDAVKSPLIRDIPGSIGLEYTVGFVFHAANLLCLASLAVPDKYYGFERYSWAVHQLFDARWGVRHLPRFDRVPSRRAFVARRLFDAAWLGAVLYLYKQWPLRIQYFDFLEVPEGFLLRLHRMTLREIIVRVYVYVTSTFVPYCTLRLAHCVTSAVVVLCGDEPERWPPLFGRIGDAYTLRNFYARFWHQLMRKPFTSVSIFLVRPITSLVPKRIATWLITLCVFFVCAIFHVLAGHGVTRCAVYGQTRYYMSTAVAMVFEDMAISAYRNLTANGNPRLQGGIVNPKATNAEQIHYKIAEGGEDTIPRTNVTTAVVRETRPRLMWRLLGYAWVFGFDTWAVTKLVYHSYQCRLNG